MMRKYLTAALPQAPVAVPPPFIPDWRMYGNDSVGDCTWAGILHARMADAKTLDESELWPADGDVVKAYLAYNGGQDTGCVEADLLKVYQTAGLLGDRCEGYAPAALAQVPSVVSVFGNCYIGLELPDSALPSESGIPPWTMVPSDTPDCVPNPANGHCATIVGYDQNGPWLVTWSKLIQCSWAFLTAYCDECWVIFTGEFLRANPGLVNVPLLLSDLESLDPPTAPNPLPTSEGCCARLARRFFGW
jgi:hypothetical protein